jgi:hypothetical protein
VVLGLKTDKHLKLLAQSPFTGHFLDFRWRHFAFPSMSPIFLCVLVNCVDYIYFFWRIFGTPPLKDEKLCQLNITGTGLDSL